MKYLFVNVKVFFLIVLAVFFMSLSAISLADGDPNAPGGVSYITSGMAESVTSCWFQVLNRISQESGHIHIELDGCQIIEYEVTTMDQGDGGGATADLEPDDLIIVWDEDDGHGEQEQYKNFTFSGDFDAAPDCDYINVSSTDSRVNWAIYIVTTAGTLTKGNDGTNEHEAIHVERQLISEFTKDDGLAESACVQPGDEITYEICWNNQLDPNGVGQDFYDVYIKDYLPNGVTYPEGFDRVEMSDPFVTIPADPAYDPNDHSYVWILGDILSLDSGCVTLDVVVNNKVAPGGNLHNVAEMWADTIRIARETEDTSICCEWDNIDPNMIYVDHTAKGAANGLNWQDAYTNLQDALYRARTSNCIPENGYTIYVAQGTYNPGPLDGDTFDLPDNVSMYGGFKTGGIDFEYCNPDKYETILDGMVDPNEIEQNDTVVTMGDNTLIDGFIITDALYYGVYGDGVDFGIQNCTVRNSEQLGIKAENGNVSIKWCRITNNEFHGIEHAGEDYTINLENSVITSNLENGLLTLSSTPTIKNCVIANNGSAEGDYYGINILIPSDVSVLHNNTIVHNENAGVFFFNDDPNFPNYPEVENCILWYNNENGGQISGCDPNYLFYNCIYDANDIDSDDYTQNAANNYNFTGNPGFAYNDPNQYDDPSIEFNPHLAYDSPCIDMGSPLLDYTDQNDIDAEGRDADLHADIGADEVYSCDGDLSEDDLYNSYDINADGIVNLWEFGLLSAAWLTYEPNHPSFDPNAPPGVDEDDILRYDARCDFDSDWHVGESDLELFSIEWLWVACWKQSQMNRFLLLPATLPMSSESMMMPMSMESSMMAMPVQEITPAPDFAETLNEVINFVDAAIVEKPSNLESLYDLKILIEDILIDIQE